MTEKKLKKLLQSMSLTEKINQMLQVSGEFLTEETVLTGPMKQKGFTEENIGLAGSVIGVHGAQKVREIQSAYLTKHPHRIPLLFMMDVINGYRTIFPIPLGQGATFDPELSCKCAAVAAKEAAVSGIHVTFAPMVDLVRDARWGRVMESTGEDPYLNSLFAEANVKGLQGETLSDEYQIAACIKHFAAYGAPTAGRDYNTVELSEHTLRQFYLPAYEAGISAGAGLVMTAFNTINGIPASGNQWLMKNVLRDEMKFEGVLISDWGAIEEMVAHGYCENREEAALRAMNAGVDIDMMTGVYSENLSELVVEGRVNEEEIDQAAYRILQLKNRLGLFEKPFKDASVEKEKEIILCEENRLLARNAAAKSFVLLKNEKLLPIRKTDKIAFIGPYVNTRDLSGSWSFTGDSADVKTIEEVVKERFGSSAVCLPGSRMLDKGINLQGFQDFTNESSTREQEQDMLEKAVEEAGKADLVIMALGEHYLQSGEATSRGELEIPEVQLNLFKRICEVNKNVAVVLFSGRPLDLRRIAIKANAVLQVWFPGTEGAEAIIDVLTGAVNPSGKLPISFPYSVGQVPIHYNEYLTGRPFDEESLQERFRSKYIDVPNEPLFPFGYGLSYTTFRISNITLSKSELKAGEKLSASVEIENTGMITGTEVLQLYIRDVVASVVRPIKELKCIRKVTLQPKQKIEVNFVIDETMLRFYTAQGKWESEPGLFKLYIGNSSKSSTCKELMLVP
ncbi:beta-glucosidase BglX [Lachnospiraceae bacterium ZAX-1]